MALLQVKSRLLVSPDVLQKAAVSIVKVTATWCGPCKRINPYFLELCSRYPDIEVYELDISKATEEGGDASMLLSALDVSGVPTFVCFKKGVEVAKYVGISEEQLGLLFATAQLRPT